MPPRRLVVTITAAAFALSLTACMPIDTDGARPAVTVIPSASAAPADPQVAPGGDCGGRPVSVATAADVALSGDCPQVDLTGIDVDIDLTRATVGDLVVTGDRNDIEAAEVETVLISGQDNDLDASAIGSLELRGDRNDVGVRGEIGAIVVNGNDNDVDALSLGDVIDNGDRNDVAVDD